MANWINNTVDADKPLTNNNEAAGVFTVPWVNDQLTRQIPTKTTAAKPTAPVAPKAKPTPTAMQTLMTPKAPKPVVEEPVQATLETVWGTPELASTTEALEAGISSTWEAIKNLPIQTQDRIIEENVEKEVNLGQAAEFAGEREDIINTQDEALAETEAQIEALSKERAVRDAEVLTGVHDKASSRVALIVEEQRLKNEIAEKEAEQKIDVSKQQATWAFNKLWLWFSSWIILEVQRIATRGATQLALIKVTWAKHLADTKLEAEKLDQAYSTEINRTIDKYTDLSVSNKQSSIQRIADVQNNLLLNNQQKEAQINKIKDSFKTNTRKLEDDMRTEQERMSDKLIKQTAALDAQVANGQNQEKTVINNQFQSGSWFSLTEKQKGVQLQKAGLWLEEGKAMEDTAFSKTITTEINSSLGNSVTVTWTDRGNIQTLATSYMEGWLVFAEANKRATLDYINASPRLSRVKDLQDAKLKAALAPKVAKSSTVKPKPQIKIDKEWRFVSVDPVTGTSSIITDEEGESALAQVKKDEFAELLKGGWFSFWGK